MEVRNYKGYYIFKVTRNTYAIGKDNNFRNHIDMFGHYPRTLKAAKAIIDEMA